MNELRFDQTVDEWIIVAEGRGERPHGFAAPRAASNASEHCPFCPGHEAETPPALECTWDPAQPGRWLQRVVPNRFAALSPFDASTEARLADAPDAGLQRRRPALGAHEVIIESDQHDGTLHTRSAAQLQQLFEVYQRRVRVHASDTRIEAVSLFKNDGPDAGASLPHPHSQLIALPWLPAFQARKLEIARRHLRARGRSLYAELRDAERQCGERVLFESAGFIAYAPFASATTFELWVVPLADQASFLEADAAALRAAGEALARALRALFGVLGACSYNVLFHVGTPMRSPDPALLWFMQILPRLGKLAGLELSTGVAVNSRTPESAAALLRQSDLRPHPRSGAST